MPVTRRAVLAAMVVGLSGCAASPVISGAPALAPSSPPPTQSPEGSAAQLAVARLRAALEALDGTAGWTEKAWGEAALTQCDAHLSVLALPDPFGKEDQVPFTVETPNPVAAASLNDALAELSAALTGATDSLGAAATASAEPGTRLLYTSALCSTAALSNRALLPLTDGPGPVRLAAQTTLESSLPIALGHAWALIYGLGVGIGRLGASDGLHDLGVARLAAAKELRNVLRDALTGEVPEQPAAFELPNAMSTSEEIRSGWAALESNLMNGYARLVAASDDIQWREAMVSQVSAVQAVSGRLGAWPGWVE